MDRLLNSFGSVVTELRHAAGLSQEALADRAGVHRTYVSQLERGLKSPTLTVLFKLGDALAVRPSKLLLMLERIVDEL